MTLPVDILHIEARHKRCTERLWTNRGDDIGIALADLATMLRAYRELAHERDEWRRLQHKAARALGSRIRECDRLRGDFQFQQNKADSVVTLNLALEAERDRLRAENRIMRRLLVVGPNADELIDQRLRDEALADAQHPEQQPAQEQP